MIRFLESIIDAIVTGLDGIASFFRLIVNVFYVVLDFILELPKFGRLLVNFLADVPAYLAWLPGEVVAVCVVIFVIAIIWKIFGRT